MNIFFPKVPRRFLPRMLGVALWGALIAGVYGILHDQITYAIGPEYFTKFKFAQFPYADFGFPSRVFVAEIGFLATWWVGFFAGWFSARIAVPAWSARVAWRRCFIGFAVIFISAASAAVVGYILSVRHSADYSHWTEMCQSLGVTDIPAFVRVAYIHNAGYLGGLAGLAVTLAFLYRAAKAKPPATYTPTSNQSPPT